MTQDLHKNLTGTDLHESKGVAAASINTVFFADGAGSGSFQTLPSKIKNSNLVYLTGQFADIGTADSIFIVTPIAGKVQKIYVVLHNAITVANSVVTAKIATVAVGGLSITITQAASAAGSVFSGIPSSANTMTAGQALEVITDGGCSTTCIAYVTIELDVS